MRNKQKNKKLNNYLIKIFHSDQIICAFQKILSVNTVTKINTAKNYINSQ